MKHILVTTKKKHLDNNNNNNNNNSPNKNYTSVDNTNNSLINNTSDINEYNLNKEYITENIDVVDINNINTQLSLNNKKKIINLVKNLDENQRIEIYKLIINDTDKFTKKTDGIIVDLNNLSEQCVYKIFCYIKYNEDNVDTITEI